MRTSKRTVHAVGGFSRRFGHVAWGFCLRVVLAGALASALLGGGCAWLNTPEEDKVPMRRPSDWLNQPRPESQYEVH